MSDLFSPMPLPARPVQRLADIAEREAAAKQKEIDTRLQESMETSRLQTMHEIGESKEEYRTTLEKLQQDYRREALSQPSRTYASGSSSRGQSLSRASSASTDRVAYNLENARLSGQFNKAKLQMRIAADSFGRTWQEEGWDDKTGWDNWQGIVETIVGGLIYSQDENWSSVNTSFEIKMNQWIEKMGERVHGNREEYKTADQAFRLNSQAAETFESVTNWYAAQTPPGDALGLGMSYELTPGWDVVEDTFDAQNPMVGKDLRERLSEPWRYARNAHIERLARGAVIETQASLKAAQSNEAMHSWSLADHTDKAIGTVMGSAYYNSVDLWEIDEDDIRDNHRSKMALVLKNIELENKEGLADFVANSLAGNHADMDPVEYQRLAMSYGVSIEKAWRWAQEHQTAQERTRWDAYTKIQKANETIQDEQRAQYASDLRANLLTNPQYLGNAEAASTTLQRLEHTGYLDKGGAAYFARFIKEGNASLLNLYASSRGVIDDYTLALSQDTGADGGFVTMIGEQDTWRSVARWNDYLHQELDRMILDGEDGDRLTPDSMLEFTKRTVLQLSETMKLRPGTRTKITGISRSPGGEAQPMTAFQIKPLPGSESIFARSVLDVAGVDEEGMDEYNAMAPELRSGWAINQIPLTSYGGTADDDDIDAANEATLRRYRQRGAIRAFVLDRAQGQALIQLAANGEWHFRQLDDREAVESRSELAKELYEAMDIEAELFQGINSGNVGLTHEVPNAFDGTVWEGPTAGAEVIEWTTGKVTRAVVKFAQNLTTINWEEMGAMLRKQDIHGEAWGYTGLRPWQME